MTASPVAIRQESLESLKARLDEPQVAAAVSHLLDHADLLAVLLVGLDGLVSRTETIGDSLADSVGDLRELAASFPRPDGVSGGDVVAGLVTMSTVLPKVAGPLARIADSGVLDRVVESGLLDSLAAHADLLAILLVGLDGFVKRGDTISDALADGVGEIRGLTASLPKPPAINGAEVMANLVALTAMLPTITRLLTRLLDTRLVDRVLDSGMIESLLDSGMLNPQTMNQLAMVGRALADASADPGRPEDVPGLLGLLKLRKDPQIGRGLAFSLSMLRALGTELEAAEEPDR
jgi:uncharacterized protein YjgD (DUF1641 family)